MGFKVDIRPYYDFDCSQGYHKSLEGISSEGFEKVQEILLKWKEALLPEDFCNWRDFGYIREGVKKEEAMYNFALNVLHIVHRGMVEPKAPSAADLQEVQNLFISSVPKLEEEIKAQIEKVKVEKGEVENAELEAKIAGMESKRAEMKHDFEQLAIHPRLVTKCSEEFLRRIDTTGKTQVYEYQLEEYLSRTQQQHENNPAIARAFRECARDLFLPQLCSRSALQELDRAVKPDFTKLNGLPALRATYSYIISLVNKELNENRDLSSEELCDIEMQLGSLAKLFEANNASSELYEQRDLAEKVLAEAKANLASCHATSKENIANLEKMLAECKATLKEAEKALYYYKKIEKELQPIISKTKGEVELAEKNLNEGLLAQKTELSQLGDKVSEAEKAYKEALAKAKEAPIAEASVVHVSSDEIGNIRTLSENGILLVVLLETFLDYAKKTAEREIVAPSSRRIFSWW